MELTNDFQEPIEDLHFPGTQWCDLLDRDLFEFEDLGDLSYLQEQPQHPCQAPLEDPKEAARLCPFCKFTPLVVDTTTAELVCRNCNSRLCSCKASSSRDETQRSTPSRTRQSSVSTLQCEASTKYAGKKRLPMIPNGYSCPEAGCGEVKDRNGDLNKHLQLKHTPKKDRRHKCEECGDGFAYPKDVKRHQKTHTRLSFGRRQAKSKQKQKKIPYARSTEQQKLDDCTIDLNVDKSSICVTLSDTTVDRGEVVNGQSQASSSGKDHEPGPHSQSSAVGSPVEVNPVLEDVKAYRRYLDPALFGHRFATAVAREWLSAIGLLITEYEQPNAPDIMRTVHRLIQVLHRVEGAEAVEDLLDVSFTPVYAY